MTANRNRTRRITVGRVPVGGGAPVTVQSMGNADPRDAKAILAQIARAADAGCDIFRLAVPDLSAAETFAGVAKLSPLPLVADIHFDWRCAIAAIEGGAAALRINPGNIGGREKTAAVAAAARGKGIPIRIGVNKGSLEKDLREKLSAGTVDAPSALVESALRHLEILESAGFRDVAISVKASDVTETVAAYRLLSSKTDCPLHLGVTEAGTFLPGTVRSAVAMGILLSEGIGDTIRVSLTGKPEDEVRAGVEILRSLGLRPKGPSVISCPTCGRTKVALAEVAAETETALEAVWRSRAAAGLKGDFPKVAVMGCAVNGPGEAKDADVALCGGDGDFVLYVKGVPVERVSRESASRRVVEHVLSL